MFGYPNTLESVALREIDFPQRLFDYLSIRSSGPARQKLEHPDIHRAPICAATPLNVKQGTADAKPLSALESPNFENRDTRFS